MKVVDCSTDRSDSIPRPHISTAFRKTQGVLYAEPWKLVISASESSEDEDWIPPKKYCQSVGSQSSKIAVPETQASSTADHFQVMTEEDREYDLWKKIMEQQKLESSLPASIKSQLQASESNSWLKIRVPSKFLQRFNAECKERPKATPAAITCVQRVAEKWKQATLPVERSEEKKKKNPLKKYHQSVGSQSSKFAVPVAKTQKKQKSVGFQQLQMTAGEEKEYAFWQKVLEKGEEEALKQLNPKVTIHHKPLTTWGNIAVPYKYTRHWSIEQATGRDSANINEKFFWQKVLEHKEAESRQLQNNELGKWEAIRVPLEFWPQSNAEHKECRKATPADIADIPLRDTIQSLLARVAKLENAQKVQDQGPAAEERKKKNRTDKQ